MGKRSSSKASEDFDLYVEAHWGRLVRFAHLLGCTSVAEAEDIVQSVLVKAMSSWGRITSAKDPDAYVHQMIINRFRTDRRRFRHRDIPLSEPYGQSRLSVPQSGPETVAARRDSFERAFSQLTANQRAIIALRFYEDLAVEQIANVLGVPIGTVKSRLSRALAQLSKDVSMLQLEDS